MHRRPTAKAVVFSIVSLHDVCCVSYNWTAGFARNDVLIKFTPVTRIEFETYLVHHFLPYRLFLSFPSSFFFLLLLHPFLLLFSLFLSLFSFFFCFLFLNFRIFFTSTCSSLAFRRKGAIFSDKCGSNPRFSRSVSTISVRDLHFRKEFYRLSYKVDRLSSIRIVTIRHLAANFDRKLKRLRDIVCGRTVVLYSGTCTSMLSNTRNRLLDVHITNRENLPFGEPRG